MADVSSWLIMDGTEIVFVFNLSIFSRWWFQVVFIFTPKIVEDSHIYHFDQDFFRWVGSTTTKYFCLRMLTCQKVKVKGYCWYPWASAVMNLWHCWTKLTPPETSKHFLRPPNSPKKTQKTSGGKKKASWSILSCTFQHRWSLEYREQQTLCSGSAPELEDIWWFIGYPFSGATCKAWFEVSPNTSVQILKRVSVPVVNYTAA